MSAEFKFHDLDVEMFFVRRLADHGRKIFLGETSPAERRERIRAAILERGVDVAIIGKHAGKGETYAAAFERFYGMSLYQRTERTP